MIYPKPGDYVTNLSRTITGRLVAIDGFLATVVLADGTHERRAVAELERAIGIHEFAIRLEFAWFPIVGIRARERARNAASCYDLDDEEEVVECLREATEILNREDYRARRLPSGLLEDPEKLGPWPVLSIDTIAKMVALGVKEWRKRT